MSVSEPVAIVRCRLAGSDDEGARTLRYVPLAEFGLWCHLMETRHQRAVTIESVSVWVAEDAARWNSGWAAEDLEPVLRVRMEVPGPSGITMPVERFFPRSEGTRLNSSHRTISYAVFCLKKKT